MILFTCGMVHVVSEHSSFCCSRPDLFETCCCQQLQNKHIITKINECDDVKH